MDNTGSLIIDFFTPIVSWQYYYIIYIYNHLNLYKCHTSILNKLKSV